MSLVIPTVEKARTIQHLDLVPSESSDSKVSSAVSYLFQALKGIGEGIAHLGMRGITYASAAGMTTQDSIRVYRDAINQVTGNDGMSRTCHELAGRVAISLVKEGEDVQKKTQEIELKLLTMIFRLGTSVPNGNDVSLKMLVQLFGQLGAAQKNFHSVQLTLSETGYSPEDLNKLKEATSKFSKVLFEKALARAGGDSEAATLIKWLTESGYLALLTDKVIPDFVANVAESLNPNYSKAPAYKPLESLSMGRQLVHFFKSAVNRVIANLPTYRQEYQEQEKQLKSLVESTKKRMEAQIDHVPLLNGMKEPIAEVSQEIVNALVPNIFEECLQFLNKDFHVVGGQREVLSPLLIHFLATHLVQLPEIAEDPNELEIWKSLRGNSLGMMVNQMDAYGVLSKKDEYEERLVALNGNDQLVSLCEGAADRVTAKLRQSFSSSDPELFHAECVNAGLVQEKSVSEGLSASLNWMGKTQDPNAEILWTLINQHFRTVVLYGADRLLQVSPHLAETDGKDNLFISKMTHHFMRIAPKHLDNKKKDVDSYDSKEISQKLLKKMFPKGELDLPVADQWKNEAWKRLNDQMIPFALNQVEEMLKDPAIRNRMILQFLSSGSQEDLSKLSPEETKSKLKEILSQRFSHEMKATLNDQWEKAKNAVNETIHNLFGKYGDGFVATVSKFMENYMITAFVKMLLSPIASLTEFGINTYGARIASSWVEKLSSNDHEELVHELIQEAANIVMSDE